MRDDRRTGAEARGRRRLRAAGARRRAAARSRLHLDLLRHPARSLAAAGITLRRRLENGALALAAEAAARAGTARAELEARGGRPARRPSSRVCSSPTFARRLEPVAVLRTRRSGVHVADASATVAEVTVDTVDVLEGRRRRGAVRRARGRADGDGDEDDLERLGRDAARAGARRRTAAPKVMRVLQVDARPRAGQKGATLRDLLVYQLRAQLDQLDAHDPGVRARRRPEDVHRFRVATRRSRALIRATGRRSATASNRCSRPSSGGSAGRSAPVRDLDVLIARLRVEVAALDVDREAGRGARRRRSRPSARRAATSCSPRSTRTATCGCSTPSPRPSTRCRRARGDAQCARLLPSCARLEKAARRARRSSRPTTSCTRFASTPSGRATRPSSLRSQDGKRVVRYSRRSSPSGRGRRASGRRGRRSTHPRTRLARARTRRRPADRARARPPPRRARASIGP